MTTCWTECPWAASLCLILFSTLGFCEHLPQGHTLVSGWLLGARSETPTNAEAGERPPTLCSGHLPSQGQWSHTGPCAGLCLSGVHGFCGHQRAEQGWHSVGSCRWGQQAFSTAENPGTAKRAPLASPFSGTGRRCGGQLSSRAERRQEAQSQTTHRVPFDPCPWLLPRVVILHGDQIPGPH